MQSTVYSCHRVIGSGLVALGFTTSSFAVLTQGHRLILIDFSANTNCCTVDFTSHGTPVGVASGNLWLVRLATFTLQPMAHTNHKFPAATATGIPCEVKLTVHTGPGEKAEWRNGRIAEWQNRCIPPTRNRK